jgi:hypothetical protein
LLAVGLKRKQFFNFREKRKWASFREISQNSVSRICSFSRKFSRTVFFFAKTFVIFLTFRNFFSQKEKTNFREIFAKIR